MLALGVRNCPVVQWLGLYASTAGGTDLIPGPGTEISQAYAVWYSQKKKKKLYACRESRKPWEGLASLNAEKSWGDV